MSADFYRSRGAFPHLEGLRGIAVVLVLLHHLNQELPTGAIVENGRYGVTIFFVLSGFLIASLLLRELAEFGRVDGKRFLVRRFARIVPAYAAVLGLYLIAVIGLDVFTASNKDLFVDKLFSLLTFTSNWHESATEGPFFVSWSLGAEMQFYALLILVVLAFGRRGAGAVVGMAALVIVGRLAAASFQGPEPTVWLLRGVEESIWVGVLAAALLAQPGFRRHLDRWVSPSVVVGLLVSLFVLLSSGSIPHKHGPMSIAIALLSAACIVSAARSRRVPLLANRLVEYLGARSYGIYLLHMIVILLLRKFLGGAWTLVLVLPLSMLAAELLHRWVEKPGGEWLQNKLRSALRRRQDTTAGVEHSA